MAATVIWLVPDNWWFSKDSPQPTLSDRHPEADLEAAEQAFSEGAYGEASDRLRDLLGPRSRQSNLLSPAAVRRAASLEREAALMRDLSAESIPEILRAARGLSDRAWREQFRTRYQGRAFVFDSTVRADGAGDFHLDFAFPAEQGEVRLSLRGLRLFEPMNLREPQRLIFGFRLADARRDPRGGWVVTADPDSGVLLRHPAVLGGTSLATDPDVAAVLRSQVE